MSHYADSDAVTLRLKALKTQPIDDDLLAEGLQAADEIIDSTVPGAPFTSTVPYQISRAATYYAAMDILDIMFSNMANRNPIATTYETRAKNILVQFI